MGNKFNSKKLSLQQYIISEILLQCYQKSFIKNGTDTIWIASAR